MSFLLSSLLVIFFSFFFALSLPFGDSFFSSVASFTNEPKNYALGRGESKISVRLAIAITAEAADAYVAVLRTS